MTVLSLYPILLLLKMAAVVGIFIKLHRIYDHHRAGKTHQSTFIANTQPIDNTEEQNATSSCWEHIVRVCTGVVPAWWWYKWEHRKEDIAEKEHQACGPMRSPVRIPPMLLLPVEVQVYECTCNKGIDPSPRVRVQVDHELIDVTVRWNYENKDCHGPMQ